MTATKVPSRKRRRLLDGVFVELSTPKGTVFSGRAAAVEFSPMNVVVRLESAAVSYFGVIASGELVLRIGREFRFFAFFRATASVLRRRLTIVAEVIEPITAPFRNCGNPMCDSGEIAWRKRNALRRKRLSAQSLRRHRVTVGGAVNSANGLSKKA